jgi:tRNA/tmRNA/rRNA uracil-C5-methylase (TrmA/RlmC/RlmD family)
VGLFSVTLAAQGRGPIIAIEGDAISGMDLSANAKPFGGALTVKREAVEDFVRGGRLPSDATIVVDPPRTGVSRTALDGVLAARARKLAYVSCDVATLARDLRRAIDAGYRLTHVEAFDLFPNTAHVETLAVLEPA